MRDRLKSLLLCAVWRYILHLEFNNYINMELHISDITYTLYILTPLFSHWLMPFCVYLPVGRVKTETSSFLRPRPPLWGGRRWRTWGRSSSVCVCVCVCRLCIFSRVDAHTHTLSNVHLNLFISPVLSCPVLSCTLPSAHRQTPSPVLTHVLTVTLTSSVLLGGNVWPVPGLLGLPGLPGFPGFFFLLVRCPERIFFFYQTNLKVIDERMTMTLNQFDYLLNSNNYRKGTVTMEQNLHH